MVLPARDESIFHQPVLLLEVAELLNPKPGDILVDATIGLGGHARHLLSLIQPAGQLIGIDCDKYTINLLKERLKDYLDQLHLFCDNFVNLGKVLKRFGSLETKGILLDLGISSYQLSDAHRGFSFQQDGPLDMRMNPDAPLKASEIVNNYHPDKLLGIIQTYGEERWAKRIVRKIVEARKKKRLDTTRELSEIIKRTVPYRRTGIHPATRVFQALRIEVNNEIENLKGFLGDCDKYLSSGARIAVISFHSLEDRLVKQVFNEKIKKGIFKRITKKPIRPTFEEVIKNPRSRSAKLRVAEKI